MPSYLVTWQIDAEADTPVDAARWAWEQMRKPDSTANVFDVCEEGTSNVVRVDLEGEETETYPTTCDKCGDTIHVPELAAGTPEVCAECADAD